MLLKNLALIFALLTTNPNIEAQNVKENYNAVKIDLGGEFNFIEGPVHEWGSRMGLGAGLESRTRYFNFDAGLYLGLKQSYLKNLGSVSVPLYDSDGAEFGATAGIGINLPWDFSVSSNVKGLFGFYFTGNPEKNNDIRPSFCVDSKIWAGKKFKINDNVMLGLGAGVFDTFFIGSVKTVNYLSNDIGGYFNFSFDWSNNGEKAMSIKFDCKITPDEYDDGEIRGSVGANVISYFPTQ